MWQLYADRYLQIQITHVTKVHFILIRKSVNNTHALLQMVDGKL